MKINSKQIILIIIGILLIISVFLLINRNISKKYVTTNKDAPLTYLELKNSGKFLLHLNVCDAYIDIEGRFSESDEVITLEKTNLADFEGYTISSSDKIYFKRIDEKTIKFDKFSSDSSYACMFKDDTLSLEK